MAAIWLSLLLLAFIKSSSADYNREVCDIFKRSDGLIPPPLPINFELKGEYVDNLLGYTTYEEMFFDYRNSMAKYKTLKKSIEHHYLFDYETLQVVEWDIVHPGVDIKKDLLSHYCEATDMEDSPHQYIFGYQDWKYPRPKMFNSNQVLRYGGQYITAFNETKRMAERGLLANIFTSCLYDSSVDGTILAKYYFSNDKVIPSGATVAKDVTGEETGYLSVPMKMEYVGAVPGPDGEMIKFNKTLNILWFKGEPDFAVGTFQIPPWLYCKNYRGRKEMPKFPTAFSTRVSLLQYQQDIFGDTAFPETKSYEEIFYYGEKNLARRDFTPDPFINSEIYSKFQSYTPVTSVYDFNQGLRYMINRPTGRCYITPIRENEFFDTTEDLLYRKLATPEEIFQMHTDKMEYKGKNFVRDIECDVWTGEFLDKATNGTFVKETYISTNGWHEETDEVVKYGVPVKHMIFYKEMDLELTEGISAYNFLKFKAKPPRLVVFDINSCIEHINHGQYAIILDVDKDTTDLLYKYKFFFLETAQYYLADMAQVLTPLRIQRLEIRSKTPAGSSKPLIFLLFTLLDKANLRGIDMIVAEKGADFDDAVANLQQIIDTARFNIQFHAPGSKEATEIRVKPGDMYIVTASGNLTFVPIQDFKHTKKERGESNIITNVGNDAARVHISRNPKIKRAEHEDKSIIIQRDEGDDYIVEEVLDGMTSNHLALLAFAMIFIGIGIGIAIMYLYVRYHSDRQVEDRITLQFSNEMSPEKSETSLNINDSALSSSIN